MIGMIAEVVLVLKKEQADDDSKKEYCETSLKQTDDNKKDLELSISNSRSPGGRGKSA